MHLEPGMFPKIKPVSESSTADTRGAVAVSPGGIEAAHLVVTRRHGRYWRDFVADGLILLQSPHSDLRVKGMLESSAKHEHPGDRYPSIQ